MGSTPAIDAATDADATPLPPLLAITALASAGTGVFWNAIAFVSAHAYGFSQERTLVLTAVMGAIYTAGAFGAGPILRRLPGGLSGRAQLGALLGAQAIFCVPPVAFPRDGIGGEWSLWISVIGVSFASSLVWPLVESYLTAGRHGPAMRRSIAWFNCTWMASVAMPLYAMAPLVEHHAEWAIGAMALLNVVALVFTRGLRPNPARHTAEHAAAHVPAEYRGLLRAARALLPTSYVLMSAMSPILPYRFGAIDTPVQWETPVTGTWMVVRFATLLVMWRIGFWHGRWGTLLLGWAAMIAGFTTVVLASTLTTMFVGFGLFGAGLGIVYYAALYYVMAVGHAAVDASGSHEGLIGSGYTIGPIAALLGTMIARGRGTEAASAEGGMWIAAVTAVIAVAGSVTALAQYVRERRARTPRQDPPQRRS